MKKFLVLLACMMVCSMKMQAREAALSLFKEYRSVSASAQPFLRSGTSADYDKDRAALLLQQKQSHLSVQLQFENQNIVLELTRSELHHKNIRLLTGDGSPAGYDANSILHYRGKIKGKPYSLVAISIMADQLVGVIADEKGNINIGRLNTAAGKQRGEHLIYREAELKIANTFACGTPDQILTDEGPAAQRNAAVVNNEPVDVYFEADYSTYLNNGSSITNTVNYVTALFNVVSVVYENDSVQVRISGIKVWNTTDPYTGFSSTSPMLSAFATNMSGGFPGDLAHLLSQRGIGGGIAFLNVLCSGNASKTAVSGNLSNSFNLFPVYSWSVMVIAHEMGHNLGSPHTQSCSWPGGAIDNCYATEGGCAQGPAPVTGGTIMSYCHLTGYGINLANGFGPHPGNLIRSRVITNNDCIKPGVYFETVSQTVSEESASTDSSCLDYSIVTATLKIPYGPTQPAGISLSPVPGTGLILGNARDVDMTPLNFVLDSGHLSQAIQFRVYNDALPENTESLLVNFSVNANGGNAVKRNINASHTLTITNTDYKPDSIPGMLLFRETFDSAFIGPGGWEQWIIHGAASPNRWYAGSSTNTSFPNPALFVSSNGTDNVYAGSAVSDSAVIRVVSPLIQAGDFRKMQLRYQYMCNGESGTGGQGGTIGGGGAAVDYGRVLASGDNGLTWSVLRDNITRMTMKQTDFITIPDSFNNSTAFRLAFEWRNNSSIANNPPLIIDSVVITGSSLSPVQSAAHASNTQESYLGPGHTIYFFNPVTKHIMAAIENNSEFDFGCTTVELLRTGAGASPAWNVFKEFNVSDKVLRVTTANTGASAFYTLKLYVTAAELNGWLQATGNGMADVQLVQTTGNLLSAPPASPAVFSSVNTIQSYGQGGDKIVGGVFSGNGSFALGKIFYPGQCAGSEIRYAALTPGLSYQWQVNTGSGYTNLSNDGQYNGVTTDSLRLVSVPTSYYGYRYRCVVTTASGLVYSPEYVLKFSATWLGTQNKNWENPLNWGCGQVPDAFTDVVVPGGTAFTAEVNASTQIRSLELQPGADVQVKAGSVLTVKQ